MVGQLCIVSYRWLANSIMSTIITKKTRLWCGPKSCTVVFHVKVRDLWQLVTNTEPARERVHAISSYFTSSRALRTLPVVCTPYRQIDIICTNCNCHIKTNNSLPYYDNTKLSGPGKTYLPNVKIKILLNEVRYAQHLFTVGGWNFYRLFMKALAVI